MMHLTSNFNKCSMPQLYHPSLALIISSQFALFFITWKEIQNCVQFRLSIHGKHLSSSSLSLSPLPSSSPAASASALSMPWPLWPIAIAIANCLRTNSGWVDEPKASCGHVFEQHLQKAKSYKANIALPLQKSNEQSTQKSTHITLLSGRWEMMGWWEY